MKRIDIKGTVMKLAATGGGAVAAASLNKVDIVAKQSPMIRGAIKVALGAFAPQLLGKSGKMGAILNSLGDGMIAVGAIELANATVFKDKPVSVSGVLPMYETSMYNVNSAEGY